MSYYILCNNITFTRSGVLFLNMMLDTEEAPRNSNSR